MARKRLIAPEFFKHGQLYDAEKATGLPLRIAFAGLWCQADREGRFKWRPRELKLDILPYDDGVDFGAVLSALATYGFIKPYRVGTEAFGLIPAFHKWQTFHHTERPSTIPAPLDNGELPVTLPAVTGTVTVTVTGTGTDTSEPPTAPSPSAPVAPAPRSSKTTPRGPKPEVEPEGFAAAWSAYPARPNNSKAEARRAYAKRLAEGVDPAAMLAGVVAYAAYCEQAGVVGNYRKQAATFFGPDRHWESDYTYVAPPSPLDPVYAALAAEANDVGRMSA